MRLTETEHADLVAKAATRLKAQKTVNGGVKRWQALGRLPKDVMNKTESAFAAYLQERQYAGAIVWWKFHPMRVRLAKNTYYEIDFLVMAADGVLTIYETKGGYTSEKGHLKIKLCAEALPVFKMVKASRKNSVWNFEEF